MYGQRKSKRKVKSKRGVKEVELGWRCKIKRRGGGGERNRDRERETETERHRYRLRERRESLRE